MPKPEVNETLLAQIAADAREADRNVGEGWDLIWHGTEQYPYPLSIVSDGGSFWVTRDGTVPIPAIARHIANCDPPTIQAMVEEIQHLRGKLQLIVDMDGRSKQPTMHPLAAIAYHTLHPEPRAALNQEPEHE